MKKKFVTSPVIASSDAQNLPDWISKRTYDQLINKIEDMTNVLDDARSLLEDYNAGDTHDAEIGYGGPRSVYRSLMESYDAWEYEDASLIAIRDDYLWQDPDAEDWLKQEIVDVFEYAGSWYPDGEDWLNVLKELGTFYID